MSPEKREFMHGAVEKMLDKGVIEPSCSPWSSPIVLVEKKDGDYRFYTDYRRLNALTKKDNYPLPRIDEMLEKLKGAEIFPTFDLASGYWQIPLYPPHKEQLAFVTQCHKDTAVRPVVVPTASRTAIMAEVHDSRWGGDHYAGQNATYAKPQQRYYWPTMAKDLADCLKKTPGCNFLALWVLPEANLWKNFENRKNQ